MTAPKSTIQNCRGRLRTSKPFIQGTSTSLLGLPFGFGADSNSKASDSGRSNAPAFTSAMNPSVRPRCTREAAVTSTAEVRLALIVSTSFPSSNLRSSTPPSKPTMLTWTLAPSRNQGLSDCAKKYRAVFLDALKHNAVETAPDTLRREQAGSTALPGDQLLPCPLEPVAAEVAEVGYAFSIQGEELLDVNIAQTTRGASLCPETAGCRRCSPPAATRAPSVAPGRSGPGSRPCSGSCRPSAAAPGPARSGSRSPASIGCSRSRQPSGPARRRRVDLDAEELPRAAPSGYLAEQVLLQRVDEDRLLQVLQLLQRDVEEIAGAAGRVQHLDLRQPARNRRTMASASSRAFALLTVGQLLPWRLAVLAPRCQEVLGGLLDLGPLPPQRPHDDGLHERLDVLTARVMGADLRPLVRVDAALEEGAEDGRVDGAPLSSRQA